MGTKPGVFVDGSQSTLIMASYLNDLRTLCYELAGDGTNAPATKAAARSNLGATAIGDALITAATAAAARGTLGSTVTGDALFVAATQAAARSALGLVPGVDVQAYDPDIPTVAASQAEMIAGSESSLRSVSPLRVRQAFAPHTTSLISLASQQSVSIDAATRRIEVELWGVSTTGTANITAVLTNAALLATESVCSSLSAAAVASTNHASAFLLSNSVTAATYISGIFMLNNAGDTALNWVGKSQLLRGSAAIQFVGTGYCYFSSVLASTLTFACGADSFDAGSAYVKQYNSL